MSVLLLRRVRVAALLGAALLALSAVAQTRAGAAAPVTAPLDAAQLAKLQKLIDAKHRDATIDPKVAKMLQLGVPGKPVVALQVAIVDADKSTHHVFDRLKDGSGFLVGRRNAEGFAVYRLGNDLAPVGNVLWRKDGNKAALAHTDTMALLRQELALWARFIDQQK